MNTTYTIDIRYIALQNSVAEKGSSAINLAGVYFCPKQNKAVATNGHLMSIIDIPPSDIPSLPMGKIIQFNSAKPKLSIKGSTSVQYYQISKTHYADTNGNSFEIIDGIFPDYSSVTPKNKATHKLAINIDYLVQLLKSAQSTKRPIVAMELLINPNGTITEGITINQNGVTSIIMPCKCN